MIETIVTDFLVGCGFIVGGITFLVSFVIAIDDGKTQMPNELKRLVIPARILWFVIFATIFGSFLTR